jgi:DnaK suppressor protein
VKTSSKKTRTAPSAKLAKGKAKAVPDKKAAASKASGPKVIAKASVPAKKASKVLPAKASKPQKSLKAPAQPAGKAAVKASAKAPVKVPAKVAAKLPAKTPSKAPTKAPTKASTKAPIKGPVKAAVKPAVKVPVKATAKASAKVVAKAPAKAAVPASKGAKAVALKTPKTLKTPVVSPKAPAGKIKPAAKTASKAVAAPSKPSPAPKAKAASAPTAHKAAAVFEAKSMTVKKVATPSPAVEPVAITSVAPSAPDQLVRATRPSARLAQITVPSLPPAVASTAAKASFLPSAPVAMVATPFLPQKKDPKLANHWKTKKLDQLTDADILAMPDAEYMNSVQLAYYRRKLSVLKQDILNSAGATTEHLREDTVVVPDPADRATIEEEHALELRTRDRERKLLKKIEQSIHLIDAGEYGYCDETGEPIGVGRLLARPTATLSLEAQQRRELKQKMFGD